MFPWRKDIAISKTAVYRAVPFFLLSLFIFGAASYLANSNTENLSRERFLKKTDELTEDLRYRINVAVATLLHVKGFFESSISVEPHEW